MSTVVCSYVAECFWPGVSEADLDGIDRRAAQSAGVTAGTSEEVRYLGSMLTPQDEVVFCFFEGPTSAAVESVARRARVPFARVIESTPLPSGSAADSSRGETKFSNRIGGVG